jgi:transcriptional regulator with XRE-family HTH domain
MSDLYLVLRSRLDTVTNWVTLGTDVMKRARKAKGLSYEGVARQTNVSSKTYERYEKAGRVPEHMVEPFADVLGLEIERPGRERVVIGETESDMLALLRSVDHRLELLEKRLGDAPSPEQGPPEKNRVGSLS